MKTTDFVAMSLEMSKGWIMGLAEDMKDEPLASIPGGNHTLWIIGHLAYSEANMVYGFVQGQPNPIADWKEKFDMGTAPSQNADDFPSFEDVLAKFAEVRANTMAVIDGMTDEDLAKPSHAPEEMKDWFGTIGQCLAAIPIHFAFHGGQIADARRSAGRAPLMG